MSDTLYGFVGTQWQGEVKALAGEFVDDYEWQSIFSAIVDAVNDELPEEVSFHVNGEIYGPSDVIGYDGGEQTNWKEFVLSILEDMDITGVLQSNEVK